MLIFSLLILRILSVIRNNGLILAIAIPTHVPMLVLIFQRETPQLAPDKTGKLLSTQSSTVIYLLIILFRFFLSLISAMKKLPLFYSIDPESQRIILNKNLKKMIINLFIILAKIMQIRKIRQVFISEHNVNESNTKSPHIIELQVCILKTFVMIFFLPITLLISFGMYSTTKLSKYVTLLPFTYKTIHCVPIDLPSSRFSA